MRLIPLIALVSLLVVQAGCADPVRNGDASLPPPKVTIKNPDCDTGTSHYADEVVIEFPGKKPLVIKTDIEKGVLAPVVMKCIAAGASRLILIGLTSTGGGMQSWHAYSLNVSDEIIKIEDHMIYTVSRDWPGMVINKGQDRFGLMIPSHAPVHGDDWQLSSLGVNLDLGGIVALRKVEYKSAEIEVVFFKGEIAGKPEVHWYGVSDQGKFIDAK